MGRTCNIHTCKILVRKPEEKKASGRRKHGWEDNIRLYLKEMGREGVSELASSGSG